MTEHLITVMVVKTDTQGCTLHVADDAYDKLVEHGWRPPLVPPAFEGELEYEAVPQPVRPPVDLLERLKSVVHWQPFPPSPVVGPLARHGAVAA